MATTSAHDLFVIDPAEFVAARDALVRQLKAGGARDEAAAVKALRRPSVPTWALNRVARDDADVVAGLLTAAAAARSMQERAVEGGADGDALRSALADRRAAVRDVLARASAVIDASGRSAATQQRQLETTLTAVVASDRTSELLRVGELVDLDEDEPDDDLASLLSASAPVRTGTKAPPAPKPKPAPKLTVVKQEPARPPAPAVDKAAVERAAKRRRDALRAVTTAERGVARAQQVLDAELAKLDAARAALDALDD